MKKEMGHLVCCCYMFVVVRAGPVRCFKVSHWIFAYNCDFKIGGLGNVKGWDRGSYCPVC